MAKKSGSGSFIIIALLIAAPVAAMKWLYAAIGGWGIIAIGLSAGVIWQLILLSRRIAEVADRDRHITTLETDLDIAEKALSSLRSQVSALEKYSPIIDVEAHVARLRASGEDERSAAAQAAKDRIAQGELKLARAAQEADVIIADAKRRALEIAGDALQAKDRADHYEQTARAMKNIIEGYGDQYIIPTYQLLDELAEELAHTDAGQKLKESRDHTRTMVKMNRAALCDYVEAERRITAIRFVTDAFNGRVDAILSRSKADNHGTLAQQIKDAYNLTNLNGAAFRNARITPEYLQSRLDELRWGTVVMELREQEREEQRSIKERIREEERAQREFDKALRDAAKEEETLKKAMEKVQQQVAQASDAQRAAFEAKLAELEEKLKLAEEKSQRALSMAQQTKSGHVYVISNIGSFGEEVFKIGMTRRLEPTDRVRELGDASVPFEFDIHAMIYSDDAPALEHALHKHFLRAQMNKVNPRKEFFRVPLTDIHREIDGLGIATSWTMLAAARQYRETLVIEEQLRNDPQAQSGWIQHQAELEEEIEHAEEITEAATPE
jgi:hypothetical protein